LPRAFSGRFRPAAPGFQKRSCITASYFHHRPSNLTGMSATEAEDSLAWTVHYAKPHEVTQTAKSLHRKASGGLDDVKKSVSAADALVRRSGKKMNPSSSKTKQSWVKLRKHAQDVVQRERLSRRSSSRLHDRLGHMLHSHTFNKLVVSLVLLNGLCIAAEADISPDQWPRLHVVFQILDVFFVIFFCFEAGARVAVTGLKTLLKNGYYRFELIIAALGALDLVVVQKDIFFNGIACLRLLRVARVFRKGEIGLISKCFFSAFRALAAVSCFLLLIIFMFSVPLVRLIGQNSIWHQSEEDQEVARVFGSVPQANWSLLQIMINPDTVLMQKIGEKQPWTIPVFLVFLGMTTYTTMSIIVGSITDSYKELADAERERNGRAEKERREEIRMELLEELRRADSAEEGLEGALSVFEFTKTLQSHQFQEALGELEVSDEAAAELVEMLELDGHVYYEEFIDALGAIGQDAKATQLFALKAHVSEELNQIEQKMALV